MEIYLVVEKKTYNGYAVIVNVCLVVERLFNLGVSFAWAERKKNSQP